MLFECWPLNELRNFSAGQERFKALRTPFYRGSDICLLSYAVDDSNSFRGLKQWREEFLKYADVDGTRFPFIVVGNKVNYLHSISFNNYDKECVPIFVDLKIGTNSIYHWDSLQAQQALLRFVWAHFVRLAIQVYTCVNSTCLEWIVDMDIAVALTEDRNEVYTEDTEDMVYVDTVDFSDFRVIGFLVVILSLHF